VTVARQMSDEVTDYDIQALVDGQLERDEEKRIWRHIEKNSLHLRRYEELVTQKKLLLMWWAGENSVEPQDKALDPRLYVVQSGEKH
jgi:anti-sigma factor RsiW